LINELKINFLVVLGFKPGVQMKLTEIRIYQRIIYHCSESLDFVWNLTQLNTMFKLTLGCSSAWFLLSSIIDCVLWFFCCDFGKCPLLYFLNKNKLNLVKFKKCPHIFLKNFWSCYWYPSFYWLLDVINPSLQWCSNYVPRHKNSCTWKKINLIKMIWFKKYEIFDKKNWRLEIRTNFK